MTDHHPTPDDARDELASAALDGEATDDEAARVADDPDLRARRDELAAVQAAVAAPVEVPAGAADQAVAAALAAFSPAEDVGTDAPSGGAAAEVVDLGAHRTRNRVLAAVAAVAVLALLVGVAPRLLRGGTPTSTDAASAPVAASAPPSTTVARPAGPLAATQEEGPGGAATSDAAEKSAPSAAAGGAMPSTTASALPRATIPPNSPAIVAASFVGDDLGAVSTPDELAARVKARALLRDDTHHEGATEEPAPPPGGFVPAAEVPGIVARLQACDPVVRAQDPGLGAPVFTAVATYQGTPALTYLYAGRPDAVRLITVARADCAPLDRQPAPS
ncbi:MAG: hypothetical protein U0Q07_17600 [Acidimicrobiales bacterium]